MRMIGKTALGTGALLALLSFSGAAHADMNAIESENNSIELDVGGSNLNYSESYGGGTLDTEKGWMPAFGGSLGYMGGSGPGTLLDNLYFHADMLVDTGSTNYDGAVCVGVSCTPATGTTNDTIFTLDAKLGRGFKLNDMLMLTPYVNLGYRYWDRQLTGTGGYTEDYSNGDFMAGGLIQFSPERLPLVFSLSGEVGTTFSPSMATGGSTYTLGDDAIWQLEGKVGYNLTPQWELTGTLRYTDFDYGASPIVAGGFEPDSTTRQVTALVGMAWHFKVFNPYDD